MKLRRTLAQFDYLLFGSALVLALLGVLGVYSATLSQPESGLYFRQLARLGLAVAMCLVVVSIHYRLLVDHAFLFYGVSILVLIGVLFFGTEINSSRSWITFAGFRVQPSELSKIVMILFLARILSEVQEKYLSWRQILTVGAFTSLPVVLIILQRDLGTAIMFVPLAAGMVLVAGVRPKVILILALVTLLLTPIVWIGLKDYQKQRVLVTLDPELDPQGIGYQTRQSLIAIGSGGVFGRGIGEGLQSQLGFVPESHTDFIFSLLAEEIGFLGAALILSIYLLLLIRLIALAEKARDRAGILVLAGIICLLFSHVVINVGMTVGVVPAIGIPLPLLSYGGSATLTTFIAVGLALNVGLHCYVYT